MAVSNQLIPAAGIACLLALSGAASATQLNLFEYAGDATSLHGVIDDAANGQGVFADSGFRYNMVNVFLADLSDSTNLSGAGVTLFAMWGNAGTPSQWGFSADVAVEPPNSFGGELRTGQAGADQFLGDSPELFALGPDADVSGLGEQGMIEIVDGQGGGQGFAISNVTTMGPGLLQMTFDLSGWIDDVGLFSYGTDDPVIPFGERTVAVWIDLSAVPLPTPALLTIGGLALVALRRRH